MSDDDIDVGFDLIVSSIIAGLFIDPELSFIPEEERVAMIRGSFALIRDSLVPERKVLFEQAVDRFYSNFDVFNNVQEIINQIKESYGS
jgi:hypothetical protein